MKREMSQEMIEALIEAARWAPSAGNIQPWEFVIATDQNVKSNLSHAAYKQKDLEEASIVIVVCADQKRAEQAYGERGKNLFCIQDTAAAVENILLTAVSMGLGSCWIGAFKEDQIRKVINVPPHIKPVALIPVGYPNEATKARERRPLKEIIHKERF